MKPGFKSITVIASAALFAAALTQPAFRISEGPEGLWYAAMALLTGWLDIIGPGISWVANPLLVLCWFMIFKKPKTALWLGMLATAFALSFLLFHEVIVNEAGGKGPILGYNAGYWLWVASCACVTAGAAIAYSGNKKQLANNG